MLLKRKQILNEVEKKLAEILEKLNVEEIGYTKTLDDLEPVEAQLKVMKDKCSFMNIWCRIYGMLINIIYYIRI